VTRVVVVGGGIVGCASAYYLARENVEVELLESEQVAYGASGRNPGFVWLHCRNPGFALDISIAGRKLYDTLAEELPLPFELRDSGGLMFFTSPEQGEVFSQFVDARREHGLDMELVDGAEVRRLVPPIRPDVLGGSFCPQDAHINTPLLVRSLAEGARRQGATVREGVTATGLRRDGDRVAGVETSEGLVEADHVVVASGVWATELLREAGITAGVGGERLQVISTFPIAERIQPCVYGPLAAKQYTLFRDLPAWDPAAFTEPYESEDAIELLELVAQRADGSVLLGCPMDYPAEIDLRPTLAGIAATAIRISEDFPGLVNAPIDKTWAGMLPYTADTAPIIDEIEPGLFAAIGHVYGNAAGPMTGRLIAQLILDQQPELDLEEARFDRDLALPAAGEPVRW
jgi:glycine/D-amino acid oxidase-like deaminating enzyme